MLPQAARRFAPFAWGYANSTPAALRAALTISRHAPAVLHPVRIVSRYVPLALRYLPSIRKRVALLGNYPRKL
ncbi:MAG: hypothetical protein LBM61_06250 [Prevotellaceae bacterium]|nr:hypothetical protein [Prevotellaceae bacterium]